MDLTFRLPDAPDDSELEHLYEWLLRARDLRTSTEISMLTAPPERDRMGPSLDAVELIVNSTLQLASLAFAIASWRNAAEPRSAMTIRRGDVEVTVSREGLADVGTVLGALERLGPAGEDADTGGTGRSDGHGDGAP